MPRFSREMMNKRVEFVSGFFATNPDASLAAASEAVKRKFGYGMHSDRIRVVRETLLKTQEENKGTQDRRKKVLKPRGQRVTGIRVLPNAPESNDTLVYKQVEDFVKSAAARIPGLSSLTISVGDSGDISFNYSVSRPVQGSGVVQEN